MPLSREDIRYGYLYVLGREPESEHVIATYRGQFDTTEEFGGPRSLDRNWADYKRESRRLSFPGYAARSLLLDAITFLS